ncbi:methyltransferase domain-containing protein [Aciditerrimonas ferrireducens]|uniref:Methyltransferase domain-containing protein n=1 Tax=Aciditerrimonas ferrireducens TaxID=667306 RepID=A0ABV6C5B5_9ACTN
MVEERLVAEPEGHHAQELVRRVMAEVHQEAARRRVEGGLQASELAELDELFARHAPVGAQGQRLADVLRHVDARSFVDPVVPVASKKAGGSALKRSIRSATQWYVGFVAHQVSQFATAVSRALHVVDGELQAIHRELALVAPDPAPVLDLAGTHRVDGWWVAPVLAALDGVPGRVLHGGCGDGWLVEALGQRGCDAYGVDPRVDERTSRVDVRAEDVAEHLRGLAPASLGGVVLSGVLDGMAPAQRHQALEAALAALEEGGLLAIQAATPAAWDRPEAPGEVDLAPGRPLRTVGWEALCRRLEVAAEVREGPAGMDLLVLARARGQGAR